MFFPMHQEAVIAQWLALYAHIDSFLREYEKLPCATDESVCIQLLQEDLFGVSGYGATDGWE